jgi:hypothetical protein
MSQFQAENYLGEGDSPENLTSFCILTIEHMHYQYTRSVGGKWLPNIIKLYINNHSEVSWCVKSLSVYMCVCMSGAYL